MYTYMYIGVGIHVGYLTRLRRGGCLNHSHAGRGGRQHRGGRGNLLHDLVRKQSCQVLIAHVSTAAALMDTRVTVESTLTHSGVVFQEKTPLRPHYGAIGTYLPVCGAHSLSFFHGAGPGRVRMAAVTEGTPVSAAAENSWERGGGKEGGEGGEGRGERGEGREGDSRERGREGVGRERRKRWREQGKFRCTDQTITVHVRRGEGTIMDMVLCWEEEREQAVHFLPLSNRNTHNWTNWANCSHPLFPPLSPSDLRQGAKVLNGRDTIWITHSGHPISRSLRGQLMTSKPTQMRSVVER